MVTFGSVCSGIEAASVAWEPLGFRASWVSEIEKFPSAVLNYHWPEVVNLGDMMEIRRQIAYGLVPAPKVFVGGTPCQAFSVAGLRGGLEDSRGQLTLEFVRLANEIDKQRGEGDESVIVWENVPGVLSSKDNAFGHFLGGLVGNDAAIEIPNGGKWTKSGIITGPQRSAAWRILDAQYFGVAQRRRRLFVVASARDGFDPGQVLFESEGVRRDIAPSREPRENTAEDIRCVTKAASPRDLSNITGTITASYGAGGADLDTKPLLCENYTLSGFGKYTEGVGTLKAKSGDCGGGSETLVIYDSGRSSDKEIEVSPTLDTRAKDGPRRSQGGVAIIESTIPIHDKATRHAGATGKGSGNGLGIGKAQDPSPTLTTGDKHAVCVHGTQDPCVSSELGFALGRNNGAENAVAFAQNSRNELRLEGGDGQRVGCLSASSSAKPGQGTPTVAQCGEVRRLTPIECERLQGFPDNHTLIPWRNKGIDDCPDGPRYKAIGNSMAVPVMRWIGERILKQLI